MEVMSIDLQRFECRYGEADLVVWAAAPCCRRISQFGCGSLVSDA